MTVLQCYDTSCFCCLKVSGRAHYMECVQGLIVTTQFITTLSSSINFAAEEHASAPSFKSDQATSTDPTSTGKDFQPGSWSP